MLVVGILAILLGAAVLAFDIATEVLRQGNDEGERLLGLLERLVAALEETVLRLSAAEDAGRGRGHGHVAGEEEGTKGEPTGGGSSIQGREARGRGDVRGGAANVGRRGNEGRGEPSSRRAFWEELAPLVEEGYPIEALERTSGRSRGEVEVALGILRLAEEAKARSEGEEGSRA